MDTRNHRGPGVQALQNCFSLPFGTEFVAENDLRRKHTDGLQNSLRFWETIQDVAAGTEVILRYSQTASRQLTPFVHHGNFPHPAASAAGNLPRKIPQQGGFSARRRPREKQSCKNVFFQPVHQFIRRPGNLAGNSNVKR